MRKIGVIGGTATHRLFKAPVMEMDTLVGKIHYMLTATEPRIVYIPRHGLKHDIPSNLVNYRAIITALTYHNVKYVISTTLATRLNPDYSIGDLVIPHDIIDLTKSRQAGLEPSKRIFTDMRNVFSEQLRKILYEKAIEQGFNVHDRGVVVVIEGPRLETPAEARMYRMLGGDLISMSLAPEAFMAKEAGLEYAAIAIIVNPAADEGAKKSIEEINSMLEEIRPRLKNLILETAKILTKLQ